MNGQWDASDRSNPRGIADAFANPLQPPRPGPTPLPAAGLPADQFFLTSPSASSHGNPGPWDRWRRCLLRVHSSFSIRGLPLAPVAVSLVELFPVWRINRIRSLQPEHAASFPCSRLALQSSTARAFRGERGIAHDSFSRFSRCFSSAYCLSRRISFRQLSLYQPRAVSFRIGSLSFFKTPGRSIFPIVLPYAQARRYPLESARSEFAAKLRLRSTISSRWLCQAEAIIDIAVRQGCSPNSRHQSPNP